MRNLVVESADVDNVGRTEGRAQLALGQWYWVSETCERDGRPAGCKKGEQYEWLGCLMEIGSNYVLIEEPYHEGGRSYERVHFDEYWTRLRLEPDAERVIRDRIGHYQQEASRLMAQVQEITARLGLRGSGRLPAPGDVTDQNRALVTLSGQSNIRAYEQALVTAKEQALPELFEAIEKANRNLAKWMLANTLPLKAMLAPMKDSIEEIDGRIFNVSLYAGLTEQVVRCRDGAPAAIDEKLHVMQRRLHMDEECLLDYQAGGMDFQNIRAFDAWLAKPANRDRILPFPRTIVAMRVRRKPKERDSHGSLLSAFINFHLEQADKSTFLYIRNGEQIWRLCCDMDFGELIFPDKSMFDGDEPRMVKMFAGRVDKMITVAEYEQLLARYKDIHAKRRAWEKAHPDAQWHENPYREGMDGSLYIDGCHFRPGDWTPFDRSSVYYDDCAAEIEARVKEYNRIALIIQGLFDRSEVLHPHLPVQSWTPEGFARAIALVYDGVGVLHYGEAPDFEAYRAKCNASITAGAIVTGQEDYWLRKEAERENARMSMDRRLRSDYRHTRFRPYGNPGPGRVARVAQWKPRAKQALFVWGRERLRDSGYYGENRDLIRTTLTVPQQELLNVSAYQPGDFAQFFRDPRTRGDYLKWAPLLLTAEDYHAGRIELSPASA